MLPISNHLRETIIYHKNNNELNENIAKWLRISICTVSRIWSEYQKTGSYLPKPQNSGRKPLVSSEVMDEVVQEIKKTPDITLLEMIDKFELPISESALSKRLKKIGFTYKKRHYIHLHNSEKI